MNIAVLKFFRDFQTYIFRTWIGKIRRFWEPAWYSHLVIWFDIGAWLTSEGHERIVRTVYFGKAIVGLHLNRWRNLSWCARHSPKEHRKHLPHNCLDPRTAASFCMIRLSSNCNIDHITFLCFRLGSKLSDDSDFSESIGTIIQLFISHNSSGLEQWVRFDKSGRKALQLIELIFITVTRRNLQFQLLAIGLIHSFLAIKLNSLRPEVHHKRNIAFKYPEYSWRRQSVQCERLYRG
jgi:hypothetical protein